MYFFTSGVAGYYDDLYLKYKFITIDDINAFTQESLKEYDSYDRFNLIFNNIKYIPPNYITNNYKIKSIILTNCPSIYIDTKAFYNLYNLT